MTWVMIGNVPMVYSSVYTVYNIEIYLKPAVFVKNILDMYF